MKRLLKWMVKVILEAALETVWGMIGAVVILVSLGKIFEFIERRSKKSK